MTANARRVLQDCRVALSLLEEEKALFRWRIHWVAAITLIRAVGHVLDKVDGKNAEIKSIASALFKSWKHGDQNIIFRDFIDQERNSVLKEYTFNLHPLEKVDVAISVKLRNSDGEIIDSSEVFGIGENIYRPMLGEYRSGDDARDVYSDAIEWWELQLNTIDRSTV